MTIERVRVRRIDHGNFVIEIELRFWTLDFGLWTSTLEFRLALFYDFSKLLRGLTCALQLANQRRDRVDATVTIRKRLNCLQLAGGTELFDELRDQTAAQR